MNYATFSIYFVVTLLMILSPGPAVFLVMSHGMKYGVRGGMLGALGIEMTNAFFFLVSALGLTAALLTYPIIFQALKWGGIVYLVVTGVRIILTSKERALVPAVPADDKKLVAQGQLDPDGETVLAVTGNGLKTLDALQGQIDTGITIRPRLEEFETQVLNAMHTAVAAG